MTFGPAYRKLRCHFVGRMVVFVVLFPWSMGTCAQEPASGTASPAKPATEASAASSATPENQPKAELSSKDTAATFKVHVNLVQVKVVVRDSNGKLVEGLKREDFLLYDQGKLQAISTFGIETAETRRKRAEAVAKTQTGEEGATVGEKSELPQRFVALVFDDIHLKIEDIVFVRTNAQKLIDILAPTDRMSIYTTSGQVTQEFTSDKELLSKKLLSLTPRPMMGKTNSVTNCPDINHYMADQSINKNDPQVLAVVTDEVLQCEFSGDTRQLSIARSTAQMDLINALTAGDTDNEYTYRHLEDVLRRMSGMPGERVIVLVSPGFILSTQYLDEAGIIDRANKANVVINTVDARGLYTPDVMGDIASPVTMTVATAGLMTGYRVSEQQENAYVLGDFADGTGGTFFHNSNDLESGLKMAAAAPEVSYVLGFSPQNQKWDGRYHTIKVKLAGKEKYSIQARRGYYSPKKVDDPQELAKAELQEAVFSQDEIKDMPLELQTQYFKSQDTGAHLSVISHIDVKGIHFRKAEGRNFDDLTVATVIFDENGNYVTGGEKVLEMRLLENTYQRLSRTGLTMKSSFDVKPGKYMVRQVIRDSEGAQMAARNGSVVIPY
jgi:VWFA-related protein